MIRLLKIGALIFCAALPASGSISASHDTWFEVRSPHFVIVSNASEREARSTAVRFEQIRTVFRQSVTLASAAPGPVIIVFAVKDEHSLRDLLPEYWDKGHAHPAGVFLSRLNAFYAAIQLDSQNSNAYKTFYHEYYHSLTLPYFPELPVWLSEGLATFFGNTEVTDQHATMGRPDAQLVDELKLAPLIPLDVLFKVDRRSPYYNEEDKITLFYAESWALTHYLWMAENGAHRQSVTDYLTALDQGATEESAAESAFGNLKKLQESLLAYIKSSRFRQLVVSAPPRITDARLQERQLSDAEVQAYRGGFAAVRGKTEDAMRLLEDLVRWNPNLALAQRNLALAEFLAGRQKEALASASRAIALDGQDGLTRYLRAYLRLSENAAMTLDPHVEEDLRQSVAASPEFSPPYGLLAVCLAARDAELPEALAFAEKAISLEPGNSSFQLDLAQVLIHMSRYDEAQAAAARARAKAAVPRDQAEADHFLEILDDFQRHTNDGAVGSPKLQ